MSNPFELTMEYICSNSLDRRILVPVTLLFSETATSDNADLKKAIADWLNYQNVNFSKFEEVLASIIRLEALIGVVDRIIERASSSSYYNNIRTGLEYAKKSPEHAKTFEKYKGVLDNLDEDAEYWAEKASSWRELKKGTLNEEQINLWVKNKIEAM